MNEETSDWSLFLDFPDDSWVWGPGPDEDVAAWVDEIFVEVVASGQPGSGLMAELRSYAVSFRDHDAGALWIPDAHHGVVVSLTVDVVAGDEAPLTLEAVEEFERSITAPAAATATVERVELPAGPAVRARALQPEARGTGLDALAETVAYTVVPGDLRDPEGNPAGVRLVVGWKTPSEGDALADLADDLAGLLQIERGTTV